jgi:hypothetical protein
MSALKGVLTDGGLELHIAGALPLMMTHIVFVKGMQMSTDLSSRSRGSTGLT